MIGKKGAVSYRAAVEIASGDENFKSGASFPEPSASEEPAIHSPSVGGYGFRTSHRPAIRNDEEHSYNASTVTTPVTALMAPAICGDTLKRPGSLTSTSLPSPSKSTMETSPSP